jgi:hypothetical protein
MRRLPDVKVERKPVFPTPGKDGRLLFKIDNADTFIQDVPTDLRARLSFDEDRGSLSAVERTKAGGWELPFLTCTLDLKGQTLDWQNGLGRQEKFNELARFLVVEVYDEESKTLYQCMKERSKETHVFRWRFTRDDRKPPKLRLERKRPSVLEYPWPDALRVQHKNYAKGKPVRVGSPEGREIELESKRVTVSVRLTTNGDKGTMAMEPDCPTLFSEVRKEKSALKASGAPEVDLKKTRENTNAMMRKSADWFKSMGPILILDPWGIPVGQMRFTLKVE